jgi:hypothetical protein
MLGVFVLIEEIMNAVQSIMFVCWLVLKDRVHVDMNHLHVLIMSSVHRRSSAVGDSIT